MNYACMFIPDGNQETTFPSYFESTSNVSGVCCLLYIHHSENRLYIHMGIDLLVPLHWGTMRKASNPKYKYSVIDYVWISSYIATVLVNPSRLLSCWLAGFGLGESVLWSWPSCLWLIITFRVCSLHFLIILLLLYSIHYTCLICLSYRVNVDLLTSTPSALVLTLLSICMYYI